MGTHAKIIPSRYSCVLQPCDVCIIKALKGAIGENYTLCAWGCLFGIPAIQKVSIPERNRVCLWMINDFNTVPVQCIRTIFKYIELSKNFLIPPPTPYRNTPFHFRYESDLESSMDGDGVDIGIIA